MQPVAPTESSLQRQQKRAVHVFSHYSYNLELHSELVKTYGIIVDLLIII